MIDPTAAYTKSYLYNASAVALGGRITRPFDEILESQAATALAIDGGYGSARAENFRFKEIISFRSAHSQVSGSQSAKDSTYATLASSTVEDLNILDVVTARRVVSRITSHHDEKDRYLVPAGTQFEGLNIRGCPLAVELDIDLFTKLGTYQAFRDECKRNEGLRKRFTESNGLLIGSLVKSVQTTCSDLTISEDRSTVFVPQFGKVMLAHFVVSSYAYRLTMMRVQLGCAVAGTSDVGGTQGNGTTG